MELETAPSAAAVPAPAAPDRRTEVIAGLTTFLTMSYVVVVNPQILSASGLGFQPVLTATVLAACIGSLLMGLWARLPYVMAPGMGINAFFSFELVKARGLDPKAGLGLVVWSGVIFVLISVTPLRREIARAIPPHLRAAVAAGIGLFLAFIGLKNVGLVVDNPATLVQLGTLGVDSLLFLFGLVAATALARVRKPYAFLAAMGATTLLGALVGRGQPLPAHAVSLPDFSLLFAADLRGALHLALIPPLITLLFTDLFDSISTFLGVAQAAGLVDEEGEPVRLEQALVVDGIGTLVSGLAGTSSATTYVESVAGVEAGGRTGLTAIVAALAFLPLLFLGPLAELVPAYATSPILVLLGGLMLRSLQGTPGLPLEERIPAFVVLLTIPLTFSITSGILCGFVLHPILFALAGRRREIPPMMWALQMLAIALLALEHSTLIAK